MYNPLRERNFYTFFVKGNLEPLAELSGNIPLFDGLGFSEDFNDNRGIAKIVNAQKLRRFQNKFFPRWIIRHNLEDITLGQPVPFVHKLHRHICP